MNYRDEKEPQDFRKLCKQVERERESKKLAALIERVRLQLAAQAKAAGAKVA
jgi:hypothetical protein